MFRAQLASHQASRPGTVIYRPVALHPLPVLGGATVSAGFFVVVVVVDVVGGGVVVDGVGVGSGAAVVGAGVSGASVFFGSSVVVGAGGWLSEPVMAMSAQLTNCSWGPQPKQQRSSSSPSSMKSSLLQPQLLPVVGNKDSDAVVNGLEGMERI